ncbi:hypothetical protein MJT46_009748 [Ovis ammon polii x Ovis aries]|nr:hypothetical protein MJT46_009748 [Ovis ammon polii x Ovis aries]
MESKATEELLERTMVRRQKGELPVSSEGPDEVAAAGFQGGSSAGGQADGLDTCLSEAGHGKGTSGADLRLFPEESNVKTGFEDNFSDLKWDCLLRNFLGDVLTIPIPDSTPSPANQNRRVESKDLDLVSRESFSGNFLTHTRNFEHWC